MSLDSVDSKMISHRLDVIWRGGNVRDHNVVNWLKQEVAQVVQADLGDLRHKVIKADVKGDVLSMALSFTESIDARKAFENIDTDKDYWGDAKRWNGFRVCGVSYFAVSLLFCMLLYAFALINCFV